jgi:hypothetical protein
VDGSPRLRDRHRRNAPVGGVSPPRRQQPGVGPHFQRGRNRNRDRRRPWFRHGEKSRLPMTAAPGHPDRQTFTQPARAARARFPGLSWRSDRPLGWRYGRGHEWRGHEWTSECCHRCLPLHPLTGAQPRHSTASALSGRLRGWVAPASARPASSVAHWVATLRSWAASDKSRSCGSDRARQGAFLASVVCPGLSWRCQRRGSGKPTLVYPGARLARDEARTPVPMSW